MALTADRQTRIRAGGSTRTRIGDVAATKNIFFGALLAKNASGYIVPASDAAALRVVGIAQSSADNTSGADGALTVTFITGVDAELDNAGGAIIQAEKHSPCYVASDAGVTTSAVAANDCFAGIVTEFTTTKVWVHVDEMSTDAGSGLVAPIDGSDTDTVADASVSPASTVTGVLVVIPIAIPDHATQTLVYKTAEKIEIVDVVVLKAGASAASTIQVTDGADAAITDAIAAAVDKAVTRAGTIDAAKRVLAAAATFKVVATRAAGTMAAEVLIYAIKRA